MPITYEHFQTTKSHTPVEDGHCTNGKQHVVKRLQRLRQFVVVV